MVSAALWAFTLLLENVVAADLASDRWPMPGNALAVIGLVMSVLMVFGARRLHYRPDLLMDVGLGFMVAQALLVGILDYWTPEIHVGRVSWIGVIILVYPSIAPHTIRRTLMASFAAASMDPFGLWVASFRGVAFEATAAQLVFTFLPNYIAAVLAIVPLHVIRGLGRQVTQARELGSYRLGESLGKGGMGEVYRATHRMLRRPAAIKLIRPEIISARSGDSGAIAVERFKREAQAVATLRSPHTVELYDFGVSDDGTFYYVMELLDGLPLDELVERFGPVPAERTIYLMRQACDSLAEAHARGLMHRDVKPSNIFLTRMGLSVDFVKVLDFGLVKEDHTATRDQLMLTAPDVTTGTPAFMAPETALGEQTADHRVDVYALGCVTYWLLTGELVFEADSPIKMMYRHIQDDPVPPSKRTELEVPPELDELVMRCLAKNPDDRPSTAEELSRLFQSCSLPQSWAEDRARRWWETNAPATAEGDAPLQEAGVLRHAVADE
jgi:serine/threonine-protein kinase